MGCSTFIFLLCISTLGAAFADQSELAVFSDDDVINEPPRCNINEEYVLEKRTCPPEVCASIVSRYDCSREPPPQPGCACKSGYLRLGKKSQCVPICQCPQISNSPECVNQNKCQDPNEEFVEEKSTCPGDTCKALVIRVDCTKAPPPKPGCVCKSGYFRINETSPCIPMCECPEMSSSPECQKCSDPNEEFVQEKSTCPGDSCKALVIRIDCTKAPPPKPGCVCRSGYLRVNETGPCVKVCECPEMAYAPACFAPT